MTTPLFSVYSQGENRVTATFLAVLERLSLPNMNRILQALLGDLGFSLVSFTNQPKGKKSTPDAKIGTGPAIWIETKTKRNAVIASQVQNHLANVRVEDGDRLLLLTPDYENNAPSFRDPRVTWANFDSLVDAIQDILDDEEDPPSEKESFLLREFISMLKKDGLIGTSPESRVLVFAARIAWPMYKVLSVYRRSTGGTFRESGYIAFYTDGEIKTIVPKVKSEIPSIDLRNQSEIDNLKEHQRKLSEELRKKIDSTGYWHEFSQAFHLMFLSEPDDEETVKLTNPVKNDKNSKSGKRTAFTQKYTYVNLESLRKANKTSELAGD